MINRRKDVTQPAVSRSAYRLPEHDFTREFRCRGYHQAITILQDLFAEGRRSRDLQWRPTIHASRRRPMSFGARERRTPHAASRKLCLHW